MGDQKLRLFTISGIGEASENIVIGQFREIAQYLVRGHSGRKIVKHIVNSYAQAADTRLAPALARLDSDDVAVVHEIYSSRLGGTSAEAIYQMEKGTLRTVLSKAVYAAYKRAVDLGKNK